jgi:hypothetical protein
VLERRSATIEIDAFGKKYEVLRGSDYVRRIRARDLDPSHTRANAKRSRIGTERFDHAGAFDPDRERKRHLVCAAALLDVDVVNAGRGHANPRVTRSGFGKDHLVEAHDLRRPLLVRADDRTHARITLLSWGTHRRTTSNIQNAAGVDCASKAARGVRLT